MSRIESLGLVLARNQRHIHGLLFIFTAAVIWVLASFVVQEVEDEGLSPFILSYIANSLFVVYLPIDKLLKEAARRKATYPRYGQMPSNIRTSMQTRSSLAQRGLRVRSIFRCSVSGRRFFELRRDVSIVDLISDRVE